MSIDEMTLSGTFGLKILIHWIPPLLLGFICGCAHDGSRDQPWCSQVMCQAMPAGPTAGWDINRGDNPVRYRPVPDGLVYSCCCASVQQPNLCRDCPSRAAQHGGFSYLRVTSALCNFQMSVQTCACCI